MEKVEDSDMLSSQAQMKLEEPNNLLESSWTVDLSELDQLTENKLPNLTHTP